LRLGEKKAVTLVSIVWRGRGGRKNPNTAIAQDSVGTDAGTRDFTLVKRG